MSGKLYAICFWLFALLTVGGAILVITRRNMVTAVMFLVASFLGLSALYAMLFAHFLAVIQVLVYAGAIMVLFVFVVMILNKEEEEPWALRGIVGKVLALVVLGWCGWRLAGILIKTGTQPTATGPLPADFGTTASIGKTLFGPYLFPFEAISILLLIAVVGALVLAQPHREAEEDAGTAPRPEPGGDHHGEGHHV
jgi:NADH-quinone oxidoreductase subunit J